MEPALIAGAALLVAVVGSVVPGIPGPLLSVAGLLFYAGTVAATPAILGLLVVSAVAVLLEYLGSMVAARASGASWWTTAAAGLVGLILLFVTGPIGMLLGVALTVFLLEQHRYETTGEGVRLAVLTTIGILASTVAQIVLTLLVLAGFVWTVAM